MSKRAATKLLFVIAAVLLAGPVLAQRASPVAVAAPGLSIEDVAEQQAWIDEHARWNAEHMAAARRLEAIVASLKRHDSNFDRHGDRLRDHATAMAGRDRVAVARGQARLRVAHEEARSAHHHLMADVDALAAVMAEKFVDQQP